MSGGLSGWGPAAVSGSGRRRHQARRSPPASFLALPWAACAVCTRRLLDPTRTTHEAGDAHPHTTTQDHSCAYDRQTRQRIPSRCSNKQTPHNKVGVDLSRQARRESWGGPLETSSEGKLHRDRKQAPNATRTSACLGILWSAPVGTCGSALLRMRRTPQQTQLHRRGGVFWIFENQVPWP